MKTHFFSRKRGIFPSCLCHPTKQSTEIDRNIDIFLPKSLDKSSFPIYNGLVNAASPSGKATDSDSVIS